MACGEPPKRESDDVEDGDLERAPAGATLAQVQHWPPACTTSTVGLGLGHEGRHVLGELRRRAVACQDGRKQRQPWMKDNRLALGGLPAQEPLEYQ